MTPIHLQGAAEFCILTCSEKEIFNTMFPEKIISDIKNLGASNMLITNELPAN